MNQRKHDWEVLRQISSLIVDMDGVLYRGQESLPGAREFLTYLGKAGVPFILATNNSTLTPAQYVTKLARLGMQVTEDRILTSGQASALHIARIAPPGTRVYAIGEDGLFTALRERGFELTNRRVQYVVVGMDRQLTWDKLRVAALAIRAGATFVGTNPDTTLPTEQGLVPGNGASLAALEAATGVAPLIIGKPQPTLLQLAMDKMGVTQDGTAMVGDRLETDILAGKNAGITTVLVLGGIATREELEHSPYGPDLVFESIDQFHRAWREQRSG
jgi:4-nitrophenyl phosphatase